MHEMSCVKVSFVEEYGHVEVLRQGTVGDETRLLLHADNVPWAVEVRGQQDWIRTTCGSWVPRQNVQLVSWAGGTSRQGGETGGANEPGRLTTVVQVRHEGGASA